MPITRRQLSNILSMSLLFTKFAYMYIGLSYKANYIVNILEKVFRAASAIKPIEYDVFFRILEKMNWIFKFLFSWPISPLAILTLAPLWRDNTPTDYTHYILHIRQRQYITGSQLRKSQQIFPLSAAPVVAVDCWFTNNCCWLYCCLRFFNSSNFPTTPGTLLPLTDTLFSSSEPPVSLWPDCSGSCACSSAESICLKDIYGTDKYGCETNAGTHRYH